MALVLAAIAVAPESGRAQQIMGCAELFLVGARRIELVHGHCRITPPEAFTVALQGVTAAISARLAETHGPAVLERVLAGVEGAAGQSLQGQPPTCPGEMSSSAPALARQAAEWEALVPVLRRLPERPAAPGCLCCE